MIDPFCIRVLVARFWWSLKEYCFTHRVLVKLLKRCKLGEFFSQLLSLRTFVTKFNVSSVLFCVITFTYSLVTPCDFSISFCIESLKRASTGFSVPFLLYFIAKSNSCKRKTSWSLQKALMYYNKFGVMLYDRWKVQPLFQEEKAENAHSPKHAHSKCFTFCLRITSFLLS